METEGITKGTVVMGSSTPICTATGQVCNGPEYCERLSQADYKQELKASLPNEQVPAEIEGLLEADRNCLPQLAGDLQELSHGVERGYRAQATALWLSERILHGSPFAESI